MKTITERSNERRFVVLNRKREHVATVQFFYGDAVQCDVYTRTKLSHQKKAGGYGYDKAAAALAGAVIDGYLMADHCGHVEEKGERQRKRLMADYRRSTPAADYAYWSKRAAKIGMHWANGMANLCPMAGLQRLVALGYTVIEA